MEVFKFTGLGTHWSILVDGQSLSGQHQKALLTLAAEFESRFSRFRPDSIISDLNRSQSFLVPPDLKVMLRLGLKLNRLTHGYFDLNLNRLISGLGYNADYTFKKDHPKLDLPPGSFSLRGNRLIKNGSVELDLGSLGKGFLIDKLATYLRHHYPHFLIDGGGDIYATTKHTGLPWSVAIEHPQDSSLAIATIPLSNQAVATSSSNKRRFKDFHHLLDPKTKRPVDTFLSVSVLAPTALLADAASTALFTTPPRFHPEIAAALKLQYLCLKPDLSAIATPFFTPYLY